MLMAYEKRRNENDLKQLSTISLTKILEYLSLTLKIQSNDLRAFIVFQQLLAIGY
jgi:hypothetical protein